MGATLATTSAHWARWRNAWSITTSASKASAMGAAGGDPCAVALAWAARAQAVGAFLVRCVFAWVVVWDNPAP